MGPYPETPDQRKNRSSKMTISVFLYKYTTDLIKAQKLHLTINDMILIVNLYLRKLTFTSEQPD